jgi:hypothetical protein
MAMSRNSNNVTIMCGVPVDEQADGAQYNADGQNRPARWCTTCGIRCQRGFAKISESSTPAALSTPVSANSNATALRPVATASCAAPLSRFPAKVFNTDVCGPAPRPPNYRPVPAQSSKTPRFFGPNDWLVKVKDIGLKVTTPARPDQGRSASLRS